MLTINKLISICIFKINKYMHIFKFLSYDITSFVHTCMINIELLKKLNCSNDHVKESSLYIRFISMFQVLNDIYIVK